MKLLILGNHTCGNRGDSAILRGLLDAINILNPHAEVDVISRYPVSSSWLLNRPVMGDPLFLQMKQHNSAAGVVGRVKKVLRRRYQHQVLLSRVTDTGKLRNIAIAQGLHRLRAPAVRLRRHYPGRADRFLSISMVCRSLNTRYARLWRKSRCL